AELMAARGSVGVPSTVRVDLALAAAATGKTDRIVALARDYWPGKMKDLEKEFAGPLMLLSAQSLSQSDKPLALKQYAWLADKLKPSIGAEEGKSAFYYKKVLEPAASLGSRLPPGQLTPNLKIELARVYGAVGNVVSESTQARWLKKELGKTPPM